MICRQCKELMYLITSSHGPYNMCRKCNHTEFPIPTDKEQDNDEYYDKNPHKDGRGLN